MTGKTTPMWDIIEIGPEQVNQIVPLFDAYRVFYRQSSNLQEAHRFLLARLNRKESVIYAATDPIGNAIGFTQLYPLFSSTRMGKLWLLNDLYIAPDFRGQGISLLLIDRAKELARKTEAIGVLLETEKSNSIGNSLYPRAGFTLEDSTNYYFWHVD